MGTGSKRPGMVFWRENKEEEMKAFKIKLPNKEIQDSVKNGSPLIVTKYQDAKTGKLLGKDGRIIWDGKDFVFISEKEKK